MIENQVAIVTGAASGIGKAVARDLVRRGAKRVALVDKDPHVEQDASAIAQPFVGDTTDAAFRRFVFDEMTKVDVPTICIPSAGITRDSLAVKLNKETGKAVLYDPDVFRNVLEVNLLAPTYWGMEMVGRIAETKGKWAPGQPLRGSVILIGSVCSQGNKGQVSYAAAKKALEAVAATMTREAIFYGVKWGVVHPGYTDTPMVQKLGQELIEKMVLPQTQLKRLVTPEEVADAICFMIDNSAVTRQVWVDAGWHISP